MVGEVAPIRRIGWVFVQPIIGKTLVPLFPLILDRFFDFVKSDYVFLFLDLPP